ncbi:hypothetical protein [Erythrobacter sp.]|uniref:hypothetical protein n=1 Tax=Erythrobacter sp. TaxID=1042 RepID=UPI00311F5A37
MRKISPDGVWQDFESQLDEQSDHYNASWETFEDAIHRKIATENYALAIGVMFEGFVNDLIFAYANRDCSRVMRHLEDSLKESFRGNSKVEKAYNKFGEFKARDHLTKDELKDILDSEGRNTSFPTFAAIEDRASQWLADEHRNKFSNLNAQRKAIIDAVIAVRNNLAHRSKSSLDRLNDALQAGPLHGTGLQRNVNRIQQAGHYLKSRPNNGAETRADILGERLKDAAHQLVL